MTPVANDMWRPLCSTGFIHNCVEIGNDPPFSNDAWRPLNGKGFNRKCVGLAMIPPVANDIWRPTINGGRWGACALFGNARELGMPPFAYDMWRPLCGMRFTWNCVGTADLENHYNYFVRTLLKYTTKVHKYLLKSNDTYKKHDGRQRSALNHSVGCNDN